MRKHNDNYNVLTPKKKILYTAFFISMVTCDQGANDIEHFGSDRLRVLEIEQKRIDLTPFSLTFTVFR